jgi:hypothetical protein
VLDHEQRETDESRAGVMKKRVLYKLLRILLPGDDDNDDDLASEIFWNKYKTGRKVKNIQQLLLLQLGYLNQCLSTVARSPPNKDRRLVRLSSYMYEQQQMRAVGIH